MQEIIWNVTASTGVSLNMNIFILAMMVVVMMVMTVIVTFGEERVTEIMYVTYHSPTQATVVNVILAYGYSNEERKNKL